MASEESLRTLVRRVVGAAMSARGRQGTLRPRGVHVDVRPSALSERDDRPKVPADGRGTATDLVSVEDLASIPDGGVLRVPQGARVTPLAREEAFRRRIGLTSTGRVDSEACPRAGQPLRVAIGCDHGGFAMKLDVLSWVRELGHRPVDFGTHDENPVDYPDIAAKVARAVADGQADIGVLIDGAGIGSAMAANKVPGIRAANCHEAKMAANAREHNYANVLTLGGRMIKGSTAHEVLRTFLATPWGAERHGRRVGLITALEERR